MFKPNHPDPNLPFLIVISAALFMYDKGVCVHNGTANHLPHMILAVPSTPPTPSSSRACIIEKAGRINQLLGQK